MRRVLFIAKTIRMHYYIRVLSLDYHLCTLYTSPLNFDIVNKDPTPNSMEDIMKSGIRTSLLTILILSLAIALGYSMMLNYSRSVEAIIDNEKEQLLTIAESSAKTVESQMESIKKSAFIMSQDTGFIDSFKDLRDKKEAYSNTSIKIFYKIESPRIDKVQVLNDSGVIMDEYPKNIENIGVSLANLDEVSRIMTSSSSTFSSVYFENVRTPYIYLNSPIFIDQEFQGIIRTKISIKYIYDTFLSRIQIHGRGYVSLVDRDNKVIMFPRFDMIGKSIYEYATDLYPNEDWADFAQLLGNMRRGVSGTDEYQSPWLSEREKLVSRQLIGHAPIYIDGDFWTISVVSDYEAVVDTLRENYYATVFASIVVAIGFITLTSYILVINNKKRKLEVEAKHLETVTKLNEQLQFDLDERVKLQDEIVKSKEKYEAIFDSGSDCMFVMSYDGNKIGQILEVNKRVLDRLGYSKNEIIGKAYKDIDSGMQEGLDQTIQTSLKESYTALYETFLMHKTGTKVPVEISATVFELLGEFRIVLISRDISNRIIAEEAVRRSESRFLNIVSMITKDLGSIQEKLPSVEGIGSSNMALALKLENMNLQLEKMFKHEIDESRKMEALMIHQSRYVAMGEMIGNIAHQWRQPLNTLSIIISNINEIVNEDEIEYEMLERMIGKSRSIIVSMSQTIDDFRYFFKPQESKGAFDVQESIAKTLYLTEERLSHNGITFIVEGEPTKIYGYSNQFSQIMLNLINNSADALMESDKKERWIKVETKNDSDKALVRICDNGGGINENVIDQIFEPYVTTKETQNGTGLGLYMTKMIIHKNFEGDIHVSNTPGGACFEMIFQNTDMTKT